MPADKPRRIAESRKRRLSEASEALTALQFGPKQRNETAAYTLLSILDLRPELSWTEAQAPLRGITPIIDFIAKAYGVQIDRAAAGCKTALGHFPVQSQS